MWAPVRGCRRGSGREPESSILLLFESTRLAEFGEVALPDRLDGRLEDLGARPNGGPRRENGRLEVRVGEQARLREGSSGCWPSRPYSSCFPWGA